MNLNEQMRHYVDLLESKQYKNGIYCSLTPSQETKDAIKSFCAANDIPFALPAGELHCTLIYSTTVDPDFECIAKHTPALEASFDDYALFGDDKDILVMKLKSKDVNERHNALMKEYNLSYSYDTYMPHITLSYDAKGFNIKKLDKYTGPIMFSGEKSEDLDE